MKGGSIQMRYLIMHPDFTNPVKQTDNFNEAVIFCIDNHNWGPKCENQCLNCPGQICEINGDCEDKSTEFCGNKAYFGSKCNQECNSKHLNCINCKKDSGGRRRN